MSDARGSLALSAHLAGLSLISFGSIPVILPELHQLIVVANGWVSDAEFSNFFALSQIVPGPNFVFMLSLIGWKLGGPLGAIGAALGITGPPCALTFFGFRLGHRFRDAPWRLIVSRGIVPVTIGLIIASGWVLSRTANDSWRGLAITAAAAALMLGTRCNPLWRARGRWNTRQLQLAVISMQTRAYVMIRGLAAAARPYRRARRVSATFPSRRPAGSSSFI